LEFHDCTRIHFSRSEKSSLELITPTMSSSRGLPKDA
jgi:hypothetical protein